MTKPEARMRKRHWFVIRHSGFIGHSGLVIGHSPPLFHPPTSRARISAPKTRRRTPLMIPQPPPGQGPLDPRGAFSPPPPPGAPVPTQHRAGGAPPTSPQGYGAP